MNARIERLRGLLEEPLLVTNPVNIRYLVGFNSSNAALLVEPEGREQCCLCNIQRRRFDLGHVQLFTVLWVRAGRLRRIFA